MLTKNLLISLIFLFVISLFVGCTGTTKTLPKDNKNLTDQKVLALASLKRRNYKQALEEIAAAEKIDMTDPEVYLIRGIILFAIQDIEGAEKSYKTAIEYDENYTEAHFNLCGLYLQQKKYDDAIAHCQKAAADRLYKSKDRALTTIGVIYFNKGDLDRAEEYFEQSLKVNPALVYTHNELGKLYVAQGKLADAVEEFQIAVTGYPVYDEAHYNLGITYLKLKETYKACNSFNKVLEISPLSNYGRKSKDYIKSVCNSVN
jgi:Tfp pilus assembly protein PilF